MLRTFTNRKGMTCIIPGRKSGEYGNNKRKVLKGRHNHFSREGRHATAYALSFNKRLRLNL